jgi:hypothetical protein
MSDSSGSSAGLGKLTWSEPSPSDSGRVQVFGFDKEKGVLNVNEFEYGAEDGLPVASASARHVGDYDDGRAVRSTVSFARNALGLEMRRLRIN